ncbi:type I polyketide synthase [Idiomarina xiamenensis]|uniref:Phenolphthiocerol/phthiocerol polyketide synthase subunit E n=1 Tax=Idiomarina xiamenensis 10-D-4 TaxID=740709 RepID=K2KT85_9GAMM|nr:type I polyketide synthase [Idiomarina xiamenensis]EKE80855.1 beta-ketoacyl synthase [Idiomarina xiamenensis 10-D-4]
MSEDNKLSLAKKALLERLSANNNSEEHIDIAIVGMAGRCPGADDVATMWDNIVEGRETITTFTDNELLDAGVPAAIFNDPNYVKKRGIIENIDMFDAGVFGFNPREAELMDPQHRVMLEVAFTALENAGYDSQRFDGPIGVFAGTMQSHYQMHLHADKELWATLDPFDISLANIQDSMCTRISYKLDLNGPSFSVGTYCSTSGVAIHLACQSLRSGESDMALAGAISLHVPTKHGHLFEPNNQSSPDGHTRTFDERAQGTVFSDGAGMLVLKRLDDAIEDGDTIHAVIKGSAINNDGSLKAGYTAPSVERQAEVITLALEDAGLEPEDIHYIEAHGTATELGDPIEVTALTRAYREYTDKKQFVTLGSIKTNFGHTDRAAGVIGVMKAAHVVRTGIAPPTLHFDKPNPKMDLENSPFTVRNTAYQFPEMDVPRRAGITALGVGGTNAHIILEQPPEPEHMDEGRRWQFLSLSAKNHTSLDKMRENLAIALESDPQVALADAAYTLYCGRREYGERLAVVGDSREALIKALRERPQERFIQSALPATKQPIAFMFTGVGEQYVNMANDLYVQDDDFREDMDHCFDVLEGILGHDLRDILFVDDMPVFDRAKAMLLGRMPDDEFSAELNRTINAQPCTFVVQYCLANHLLRCGVSPEAVVGYSLGEYAAAAMAGIFSIQDALKLVAERAKLIESLPEGSMIAVPMEVSALEALLTSLDEQVDIGIINGPKLTIAAGADSAIDALEGLLSNKNIMCRRLSTSHAFHSSMMSPAKDKLRTLLSEIDLNPPTMRFLSNVTGTWVTSEQAMDPQYWIDHMCQTARFGECIDTLFEDGDWTLVEVGPGQSLSSLIKQRATVHGDDSGIFTVQTMRTLYVDDDDEAVFTAALAKLWVLGSGPNYLRYYDGESRRRIPLPTYAFDRQSYWIETAEQDVSLSQQLMMSQEPKAELADSFYFPQWESDGAAVDDLSNLNINTPQNWLVFADADGLCQTLAETVKPHGINCVLAFHGKHYNANKDGSFDIRPGSKKDLDAMFKALKKSTKLPSRIVYGWTAARYDEQMDIQLQVNLGFYTLFQLAKSIGDYLIDTDLELCILSADMQAVIGNEPIIPSKALVKGPTKVIRQEFANVACRSIDAFTLGMGAVDIALLAKQLACELLLGAQDQFVALRNNTRYLPLIEKVRMEAPLEGNSRLKENGVYMITGGMGGIGLAIAEHLYRTQKARLVLIGRSALPEQSEWNAICEANESDRITERVKKINALVKAGAEVMVIVADVADEQAMATVAEDAIERFGELNGIIHAAGVPGQGLTQLKTVEAAEQTLRSKVQGTLAIAKAVEHVELDFFILVSSIAAFSGGGAGQIDYCAGNAFLDAYALAHQYDHGTTIAINFGEWQWDAWSDGLQGFHPELREAMIKHRQNFGITFEEGMEAIRRILAIDVPQVIVLPEDAIAMIRGSNVCSVAKLAEVVQSNHSRKKTAYPRPALATSFVAASNDLEKTIAEIWQNLLGIDEIGTKDNFFDLGGNSLVGLQIVADLRRELDIDVPQVILYEAPTVEAMVKLLAPDVHSEGPDEREIFDARRAKVQNGTGARDIAIVGMSGRFPGARSPTELWENLRDGVEAISFYSESELIEAGVSPAEFRKSNYVRAGFDIENIDHFDARLFGYSPREAEFIDPQHRQLLECAWAALEDAGCDPESFKGLIGIFAGSNASNYLLNLMSRQDLMDSPVAGLQVGVGNTVDALATRIAYKLNLKGPALSVQNFCSTSGVAMHMACKSLLSGECDVAMAGGVNIAVSGKEGYLYEEGGINSPDGHVRTFDADSKGAVIGDGVGVVVFKRLADALEDGDNIYAVVKGSAISNDGSLKVGYTAPGVDGQTNAVSAALRVAGINPESIQYVEAHGTATELGDPIEVTALTKAYRQSTDSKNFCAIGSIKPNTGHLDRAAGVAGMIKTVMSLKHEEIPPLLHFKAPNPNIDFENSPFYVAAQKQPWPGGDIPRRAGVNVVGLGGTNAHFILEEAPVIEPSDRSRRYQVLMLSANTQWSLDAAKQRLADHLSDNPTQNLADIAYTLQTGRQRLEFRQAVVCSDHQNAIDGLLDEKLSAFLSGHLAGGNKSLVFMFPGVGDHYNNMAVDLYHNESTFRSEFDHCCEVLEPLLGVDLREILFTETESKQEQEKPAFDIKAMLSGDGQGTSSCSVLQQTWLAQPLVFAVEYCLAHQLMSWGYVPQAVIGYSLGEFVAATVAGCVELNDALALVAKRARLINDLPSGSMLAVPMSESEVESLLVENVDIALCNSPKTTVVAGTDDGIDELQKLLNSKEIANRRLNTTHAFHSSMMNGAVDGLRELLEDVEFRSPNIAYISSLTGDWVTEDQITSPKYWLDHMCQPVRFADGIGKLLEDKGRVLVEVGPGQSLGSFVKQHPSFGADNAHSVVPAMRAAFQEEADDAYLQSMVAKLWLAGIEPIYHALYQGERRLKVSLPTYAFEPTRYWVEPGEMIPVNMKKADNGKVEDITHWWYKPVWRESTLKQRNASAAAERLLVFCDDLGYAKAAINRIQSTQTDSILVIKGDGYSRLDDNSFQIRATHPEDYDRLIRQLQREARLPSKIGHFFTVTDGQEPQAQMLELGYFSLMWLVQAFGKRNLLDPLDIIVVSSGIHEVVKGEIIDPYKSMILGPCKGISQEAPHILLRNIDICVDNSTDAIDEDLVQALRKELLAQPKDPIVAYRGGVRLLQDFEPFLVESIPEHDAVLKQHGVYLITGGLGGVGLVLARHLAKKVQAKLVLCGRSALPEREQWSQWLEAHEYNDSASVKIRKIQELESFGAEVIVLSVDAGDEQQLKAVIDKTYETFGTLNGVVHAAGISESWAFRSLKDVARDDSDYQFRPKVHGVIALQKALADKQLDFVVLTSSVSAVLGGMTLIPYAAANIFMDNFTRIHNRTAVTRWLSVNWDTWRLSESQHETVGKTVLEFEMSQQEGAEAFERLAYYMPSDHIVESTGNIQARLDQWVREPFNRVNSAEPVVKTQLYARPALSTTFIASSNEVEERVSKVWHNVLGIEEIGIHDNYFDLGGTSLTAIQLVAELQREFSVPVSPVVIFEAPTVHELAKIFDDGAHKDKAANLKSAIDKRKSDRQRGGNESTDIAIIGVAGRFPGANSIDDFWQNMVDGKESLTTFSDEQLLAAGVSRDEFESPEYVRCRPIIDNADMFDARFFGYSPMEAQVTDPQHRVLLEVAWEAMEVAGYDPLAYDGSIGVFCGSNTNSYAESLRRDSNTAHLLAQTEAELANQSDSLTTTVSFKLNLRGPSYNIQTFCSTSLVSVHVACQNIISGECDMALAGGISLRVPQQRGYLPVSCGTQSIDGSSRTFDANSSGTVFGEGAGLILLKRLEDAQNDGDIIHAVIKGSASNNDGALKASFSAPSVDGQAEAIAMALANANIDARTIDYVEASGTATELGDPIEVASLSRAFKSYTEDNQYCVIGSVKPNIGHPDRAAGILGLIKTIEALKHEMLPGTLFFESPNPKIDFANSPFMVKTELTPWPKKRTARRAGINSVGSGGTNAHVILEEAPLTRESKSGRDNELVVLSALSKKALLTACKNLRLHLSDNPELSLSDVAYTLAVGRRHFPVRCALVSRDVPSLLAQLESLKLKSKQKNLIQDPGNGSVFVFGKHNNNFENIGFQLYRTETMFRSEVDRCLDVFEQELDLDLCHMMQTAELNDTPSEVLHVLKLASDFAMARLLMSWGGVPRAMHGEGAGVIVMAVLAGVIDLNNAGKLVKFYVKSDKEQLYQTLQTMNLDKTSFSISDANNGTWAEAEQLKDGQFWYTQIVNENSDLSLCNGLFEQRSYTTLMFGGDDQDIEGALNVWPEANNGSDDEAHLLSLLSQLYVGGLDLDWKSFYAEQRRNRVRLPTYPFERRRYWVDIDYNSDRHGQSSHTAASFTDFDYCVSTPVWQQSNLVKTQITEQLRWIVLGKLELSLCQRVLEQLSVKGIEPICVVEGEQTEATDDNHWIVNPNQPHALEALIKEAELGLQSVRVLNLWPLAVTLDDEQTAKKRLLRVREALDASQALESVFVDSCNTLQLLRVTQGAQSVTGEEELYAEQALLSIELALNDSEKQKQWRTLDVMLPAPQSARELTLAEQLVSEMGASSEQSCLALRGKHRWVKSVDTINLELGSQDYLNDVKGRTFALVDGVNDLGLTIAYQLACAGAANIIVATNETLPDRSQWDALLQADLETDVLAQKIWQLKVIEDNGCSVQLIVEDSKTELGAAAIYQHAKASDSPLHSVLLMTQGHIQSCLESITALSKVTQDSGADERFMIVLDEDNVEPSEHRLLLQSYQNALAGTAACAAKVSSIICHIGKGNLQWEEASAAVLRIMSAHLNVAYYTANSSCVETETESYAAALSSRYQRPELENEYRAPETQLQKQLAGIWTDLLCIDAIGIDDNFFELGGHSLLATRLFARINRDFGLSLQLRNIFESSTIAEQADLIEVLLQSNPVQTEGVGMMEGEI